MNNKLPIIIGAVVFVSALALADDKTPAQSVDQHNDAYGNTPARTKRGTPLVGDFNEKGHSGPSKRANAPDDKKPKRKPKQINQGVLYPPLHQPREEEMRERGEAARKQPGQ